MSPEESASLEAVLLDFQGRETGKRELPVQLFGRKPSLRFLHEVVTAHLANRRLGSAHTKTRSEVSGGGRKPWKQKHTGRARHGSIRSPLWRKGGVVFGPRHRSYRQDLPVAKQRIALSQALSAKWSQGDVVILKSLEFGEPKTKNLVQGLKALKATQNTLLVLEKAEDVFKRAVRNLSGVEWCLAGDLSAYQVLRSRRVILAEAAVDRLAQRVSRCK